MKKFFILIFSICFFVLNASFSSRKLKNNKIGVTLISQLGGKRSAHFYTSDLVQNVYDLLAKKYQLYQEDITIELNDKPIDPNLKIEDILTKEPLVLQVKSRDKSYKTSFPKIRDEPSETSLKISSLFAFPIVVTVQDQFGHEQKATYSSREKIDSIIKYTAQKGGLDASNLQIALKNRLIEPSAVIFEALRGSENSYLTVQSKNPVFKFSFKEGLIPAGRLPSEERIATELIPPKLLDLFYFVSLLDLAVK